MTVISVDGTPRGAVPYSYGAVSACGGNVHAVGRPGHGCDGIGVTTIGEGIVSCEGVPDFHGVIKGTRGDTFPIGRPRYSIDDVCVAGIGKNGASSLSLPYLDGAIFAS